MDFFLFFKGQDCRKQQLMRTVQKQDFCPVNNSEISTFHFRLKEKKYIKKKISKLSMSYLEYSFGCVKTFQFHYIKMFHLDLYSI